MILDDAYFMRAALAEARVAFDADEVPVGAVIVAKGRIIARGHNMVERLKDVTAHAELMAFTSASASLGGKYLQECTLYVTLEPCPMCAGAAFWTQIGRIVFGAPDTRRGYSLFKAEIPFLHPSTTIVVGVLAVDCAELI
ncbi:MAG: nucleoside deaminase [Bacteroidota bacterium]